MKYIKKPLSLPVFFSLVILYLEMTFHLLMFHTFCGNLFYLFLFSSMFGCIIGGICSMFRERTVFILTTALTSILCIFFCAQIVYHAVFQKFLALFSMLGVAGQAFDFMDVISKNIIGSLLGILLLLLPVIFLLIGRRKNWIAFTQKPAKTLKTSLCIAAECYLIAILFLNLSSHSPYSAYDIYYHNLSTDMTVEEFGVLTMNRLDGYYLIAGKPDKTLQLDPVTTETVAVPEPEPEPEIDTSPNILNIDFDAITTSAPNENVVQLTQYFQSQSGTNKNEYTGLFKGYNVIFITAEGFSKFVIDPERTPTLYRLKNEGFVFNHYYTPEWYASTSDGEYANLTGLLPTDGIVSMKLTGEHQNNMYFTLGRQLERLNYTLNGYHNNSYTYYGRDLSHPNMGYNWHGTGNWFQPETTESGHEYWPQSDLELINQSMAQYMDSEPFHTYYMSVSGHMMYDVNSNQMSYRNYDSVADLPCSETTKGYLACQLELEKAMTALLAELESRGIADHTVIVLGADHIPYNDKPVCDELAGHELESGIEWYENDLIIWSGSMEEPVVVDKYCYDVDILPTISNLLGLEYDSRLMIGQDILSDSEQLVCFPNRSFISGKCIYNASNGSVTPLTDEEISQEYLNTMANIVYNKFTVSEMILNEDYYRYLEGNIH
ncbi:LTA synthase family protein [Sporofaciens sp. SGI.106]|uniref:LTA synthase family protein n=1 Tax=Sporofaciens sp. SGI.106 TaxID=3420568 RepID=UPI002A9FAEB2|nr:sulfatase-like hydrolase/transferase [Lachnoclostridium sp.]